MTIQETSNEIAKEIDKTAGELRARIDPSLTLGEAAMRVAVIQTVGIVIAQREAALIGRIERLVGNGPMPPSADATIVKIGP